jgi:ABC-type glycerol-3-phosphate transport system substrate-binding protein
VRQNQRLELTQSAVSLGEYVNVVHAKAILSTLFLQSGSNLVIERGGRYDVSLNNYAETGIPTGQASLAFYTQFASPQSGAYSWNRSLQSDRMKFLGGTLGMYFAPASEYASLLKGNPNLNFELAAVPQGSSATTYRNFGTFYAFAIPLRAENQAGAKLAARALAEPAVSERIITALDLGPVHRSLIARTQTDSFKKVLYQSSLIARGWLDPDPEMSDTVFKEMVESVTSGRQQTISAVSDATEKLRLLIK